MSGAQHVITRRSLQKLYRQLQNAFKNKATSRFASCRKSTGPKTIEKKTPFRRIPTAQNCCKTQYNNKIFLSHNENITKNMSNAPDADYHKRLTKATKKDNKKQRLHGCPRLQSAVKNNMESRFSSCMTKT